MPNPAEKADDADALATPMGLYNLACSYHQAARELEKLKLKTTHPTSPISFLYFHALEIFLKSFLRLHGHSVLELKNKYGHNLGAIRQRASELGLKFMARDLRLIRHLRQTDAFMRARYIKTGTYPEQAIEEFEQTVKSLRESVRDEFKKKGIPMRR